MSPRRRHHLHSFIVTVSLHTSAVVVDAAGPLASLTLATIAARYVSRVSSVTGRTFLALLLAFAGFWIGSELVSSAITNTDDVAFVLRRFAGTHSAFWRVITGATGAVLYVIVLRRAARHLPSGWPLVAAYLTAGVVSCVAAAFFRADLVPALREAAGESLGASAGLLYLALRPVTLAEPGIRTLPPLRGNRLIILLSAPVVILFWLTLGRGFTQR